MSTTYKVSPADLTAVLFYYIFLESVPANFNLNNTGYAYVPQDDIEYAHILSDARYFHLPKLTKQLMTSEVFLRVGGTPFRLQRLIFSSAGNDVNYFTVGFKMYFGLPSEYMAQTQKEDQAYLRPAPIACPSVPNRSGKLFGDLVTILEGASLHIRDSDHQKKLLQEARFYRFLGVEQHLIEHRITFNRCRNASEIVMNLADIKPAGLSIQRVGCGLQTVHYARPYVDITPRELVFQIKVDEQAALIKSPPAKWEASFYDEAREQMRRTFSELVTRLGCKNTDCFGPHGYRVDMSESYVLLNGKPIQPLVPCTAFLDGTDGSTNNDYSEGGSAETPSMTTTTLEEPMYKKRRLGPSTPLEMVCERSMWRVAVTGDRRVQLQLLRAECRCGQVITNATRQYV